MTRNEIQKYLDKVSKLLTIRPNCDLENEQILTKAIKFEEDYKKKLSCVNNDCKSAEELFDREINIRNDYSAKLLTLAYECTSSEKNTIRALRKIFDIFIEHEFFMDLLRVTQYLQLNNPEIAALFVNILNRFDEKILEAKQENPQ